MRVLVAPDEFAGTLTAVQAAEAIAAGWRRRVPDWDVDLAPMSDGGPGFLDVLQASRGGELLALTVRGPFGEPTPASVLQVGETAYVEAAQACGQHLIGDRDVEDASSYGVGQLLAAAAEAGAREVVVGLGGLATFDGGAGLLAALGATGDVPLEHGVRGLAGISTCDLAPAVHRIGGLRLVAATDTDIPLTGLFGAAKTHGPDRGLTEDRLVAVDGLLEQLAAAAGRRVALDKGAGAAGGLGFALLLLGADRTPGTDVAAAAVHLSERARLADVVLTGEGSFDFSSRSGKVPYGVAAVAADALRPCVALAGRVLVGAREMRALGVESAYAVVDLVGEERALADPAGALADLAERVARTWAR